MRGLEPLGYYNKNPLSKWGTFKNHLGNFLLGSALTVPTQAVASWLLPRLVGAGFPMLASGMLPFGIGIGTSLATAPLISRYLHNMGWMKEYMRDYPEDSWPAWWLGLGASTLGGNFTAPLLKTGFEKIRLPADFTYSGAIKQLIDGANNWVANPLSNAFQNWISEPLSRPGKIQGFMESIPPDKRTLEAVVAPGLRAMLSNIYKNTPRLYTPGAPSTGVSQNPAYKLLEGILPSLNTSANPDISPLLAAKMGGDLFSKIKEMPEFASFGDRLNNMLADDLSYKYFGSILPNIGPTPPPDRGFLGTSVLPNITKRALNATVIPSKNVTQDASKIMDSLLKRNSLWDAEVRNYNDFSVGQDLFSGTAGKVAKKASPRQVPTAFLDIEKVTPKGMSPYSPYPPRHSDPLSSPYRPPFAYAEPSTSMRLDGVTKNPSFEFQRYVLGKGNASIPKWRQTRNWSFGRKQTTGDLGNILLGAKNLNTSKVTLPPNDNLLPDWFWSMVHGGADKGQSLLQDVGNFAKEVYWDPFEPLIRRFGSALNAPRRPVPLTGTENLMSDLGGPVLSTIENVINEAPTIISDVEKEIQKEATNKITAEIAKKVEDKSVALMLGRPRKYGAGSYSDGLEYFLNEARTLSRPSQRVLKKVLESASPGELYGTSTLTTSLPKGGTEVGAFPISRASSSASQIWEDEELNNLASRFLGPKGDTYFGPNDLFAELQRSTVRNLPTMLGDSTKVSVSPLAPNASFSAARAIQKQFPKLSIGEALDKARTAGTAAPEVLPPSTTRHFPKFNVDIFGGDVMVDGAPVAPPPGSAPPDPMLHKIMNILEGGGQSPSMKGRYSTAIYKAMKKAMHTGESGDVFSDAYSRSPLYKSLYPGYQRKYNPNWDATVSTPSTPSLGLGQSPDPHKRNPISKITKEGQRLVNKAKKLLHKHDQPAPPVFVEAPKVVTTPPSFFEQAKNIVNNPTEAMIAALLLSGKWTKPLNVW